MSDFPERETRPVRNPPGYELPPLRSVREVGRVTGLARRPFPGSSGQPSILRVAIVNGAVSLGIGSESVHLDAAGRGHFQQLLDEAGREADAHEGGAS